MSKNLTPAEWTERLKTGAVGALDGAFASRIRGMAQTALDEAGGDSASARAALASQFQRNTAVGWECLAGVDWGAVADVVLEIVQKEREP